MLGVRPRRRHLRGTGVGGGGHPRARGEAVDVTVAGEVLATAVAVPTGTQPTNLACALAVALAVGVDGPIAVERLADLPPVDHRLQAVPSAAGFAVLDDTYNSNPAGARAALAALRAVGGGGRRVVVTPGMVELGSRQRQENRRFGAAIAGSADDLVVVGRTNRRALVAGATGGDSAVPGPSGDGPGAPPRVAVTLVPDRPAAVDWVRARLGPGDAVLYENDLPDHYP